MRYSIFTPLEAGVPNATFPPIFQVTNMKIKPSFLRIPTILIVTAVTINLLIRTSNLLATTTGVPAPFIALALIIGTTIVILAAFGATALYAIWKDR
jgi:hypothetical protein